MVTIKLFAILKDRVGRDEVKIKAANGTVADLLQQVSREYPALSDILAPGRIVVSVNQEFVKQDAPVRDGDEVALMPPFSGGALKRKSQIRKIKSQISSKFQRAMFETFDRSRSAIIL
jgi:molybdopterin converting factor subunit 1